jgi:hypothetical protein
MREPLLLILDGLRRAALALDAREAGRRDVRDVPSPAFDLTQGMVPRQVP